MSPQVLSTAFLSQETRYRYLRPLFVTWACLSFSLCSFSCISHPNEPKIEFIYLTVGASEATGLGATPLTEGYVYLIKEELERRIPGTFVVNLDVPGGRIDALNQQVRLADRFRMRADVATLWTGANDLLHGMEAPKFQEHLRYLLRTLQTSTSKTIVIANLPDLTRVPGIRPSFDASLLAERIKAYNRVIDVEAPYIGASIVDLSAEVGDDEFVFDANGFHPTARGHRKVAALFLQVILPRVGH
jgi:acyl-CoA thioesterase-1